MKSKIQINMEHLEQMQGAQGQCSNRRQVFSKCRVSFKRRGFEVRVYGRRHCSNRAYVICCEQFRLI